MKIVGIIPARYASTRLPGKPLLDIGGKTMIQRVYEQCMKVKSMDRVVVATDDDRILKEVERWGGTAMLTGIAHQSGTDRCAEVVGKLTEHYDFAINIQGDEPFIQPGQIEELISILNRDVQIATLIRKVEDVEELFDRSKPKVVIRNDNTAIYFSRKAIPYIRGAERENWMKHHVYFKHIGIYAYRTDILAKITLLEQSGLEIAESLEQLRWIENQYTIHTKQTILDSFGIDTPEDLIKAVRSVEKS